MQKYFGEKMTRWIIGFLLSLPWFLYIDQQLDLLSGIFGWMKALPSSSLTEWLQFFMAFMSLTVTVIVGWIGYKFNQSARIQSKMAFEEFRPRISFEELLPGSGYYSLKNTGDFDAEDIRLFTLSYTTNSRIKETTSLK